MIENTANAPPITPMPVEAAREIHPRRSPCDDPSPREAEFPVLPPVLVAPATSVTHRARSGRTASWPTGRYPAQEAGHRAFGRRRAPIGHPHHRQELLPRQRRHARPRPRTRPRRRTPGPPPPVTGAAKCSAVVGLTVARPVSRRNVPAAPRPDAPPDLPRPSVSGGASPPGTAAGTPWTPAAAGPAGPRTATTDGRGAATARVHGSHPASASNSRAPAPSPAPRTGWRRRPRTPRSPPRATTDAPPPPQAPRPPRWHSHSQARGATRHRRPTRASIANLRPATVPRRPGTRCPFPASAMAVTAWAASTGHPR